MKKRSSAFWGMMILAVLLALPSLFWRVSHERRTHGSLILFDLLELHALKSESADKTLQALMSAGVSAFLAPEMTGEELRKGVLENVALMPASELPASVASRLSSRWGTVVLLHEDENAPFQLEYLQKRFPAGSAVSVDSTAYYHIPVSYAQLEKAGVLPDLGSMSALSAAGVPLVFAPSPSYAGSLDELIGATAFLLERLPSIKAICPAGEIAVSASDPSRLGKFVRDAGLLMAHVEFSRQYGSSRQVAAAWPNVVSLHGVDREEVLKRGIIRPIMLNRLFRAAEEREVRLLVLRLDPLRSTEARLSDYCADVAALRTRLDKNGFSRLWPAAAPSASRVWPSLAAVGLGVLLCALALSYVERFCGLALLENPFFCTAAFVLALALAAASFVTKLPLRFAGAFAAGLLATEASLAAMERWRVPLRGVAEAFLIVLLGGLVIAGTFSTPLYMYRMSTYSGVKISLLLPPLLVLLLDLHAREHPESLSEILLRPPLWGELALAGVILLGAVLMIVRSGNYGFVSTAEVLFRDWIEKVLGARPRTKEFLVGYPALVCWYYLKRRGLWAHWREVLRLAVTMAFSSAVNSFCHFHTPLTLTLLRGFNGWWSGLLLGCLILIGAVCLARPLYARVRTIFS